MWIFLHCGTIVFSQSARKKFQIETKKQSLPDRSIVFYNTGKRKHAKVLTNEGKLNIVVYRQRCQCGSIGTFFYILFNLRKGGKTYEYKDRIPLFK